MTPFNDQAAWINSSGNLTLGLGINDGAGDSSHGYAKGDVFCPVSAVELVSDTQPALTRIGAGSYKRTLVAGTTHNVAIPFPSQILRTYAASPNSSGANTSPHGMKVRSLALAYRTNTNDLTSITLKVYTLSLAAAASVPAASEQASTVTGDVLTQAANQRLAIATVTTPTFVNTVDNLFIGEAVIVIPAMSTCDLLGAVWRVSFALY